MSFSFRRSGDIECCAKDPPLNVLDAGAGAVHIRSSSSLLTLRKSFASYIERQYLKPEELCFQKLFFLSRRDSASRIKVYDTSTIQDTLCLVMMFKLWLHARQRVLVQYGRSPSLSLHMCCRSIHAYQLQGIMHVSIVYRVLYNTSVQWPLFDILAFECSRPDPFMHPCIHVCSSLLVR